MAEVAVLDQAGGLLVPALRSALDPERIAARRAAAAPARGCRPGQQRSCRQRSAGPPMPMFTVTDRSVTARGRCARLGGRAGAAQRASGAGGRSSADAVRPATGSGFGTYDLYVSPGLDENTENILHESLRLTLVAARFSATGWTRRPSRRPCASIDPGAVIVGADGEKLAQRGFNRMLPFVDGHAAVHRRDDGRPDADDLDHRGKIQPSSGSAAGGRVSAGADVGQADRAAGRGPGGAGDLHRHRRARAVPVRACSACWIPC